jgi:hypothetical protein
MEIRKESRSPLNKGAHEKDAAYDLLKQTSNDDLTALGNLISHCPAKTCLSVFTSRQSGEVQETFPLYVQDKEPYLAPSEPVYQDHKEDSDLPILKQNVPNHLPISPHLPPFPLLCDPDCARRIEEPQAAVNLMDIEEVGLLYARLMNKQKSELAKIACIWKAKQPINEGGRDGHVKIDRSKGRKLYKGRDREKLAKAKSAQLKKIGKGDKPHRAQKRSAAKFDSTKGYPGEGPPVSNAPRRSPLTNGKRKTDGRKKKIDMSCFGSDPSSYFEQELKDLSTCTDLTCSIPGHYHQVVNPKTGFEKRDADKKHNASTRKEKVFKLCKSALRVGCAQSSCDHAHCKGQTHDSIFSVNYWKFVMGKEEQEHENKVQEEEVKAMGITAEDIITLSADFAKDNIRSTHIVRDTSDSSDEKSSPDADDIPELEEDPDAQPVFNLDVIEKSMLKRDVLYAQLDKDQPAEKNTPTNNKTSTPVTPNPCSPETRIPTTSGDPEFIPIIKTDSKPQGKTKTVTFAMTAKEPKFGTGITSLPMTGPKAMKVKAKFGPFQFVPTALRIASKTETIDSTREVLLFFTGKGNGSKKWWVQQLEKVPGIRTKVTTLSNPTSTDNQTMDEHRFVRTATRTAHGCICSGDNVDDGTELDFGVTTHNHENQLRDVYQVAKLAPIFTKLYVDVSKDYDLGIRQVVRSIDKETFSVYPSIIPAVRLFIQKHEHSSVYLNQPQIVENTIVHYINQKVAAGLRVARSLPVLITRPDFRKGALWGQAQSSERRTD